MLITRRRLIILASVLCLIFSMYAGIAYAAPVYITGFSDFPAYPYNTVGYMQGGAYVGCGPTTGAMIFGYFQHHFGLTTLLVQPAPVGVNEGLNTAWALHDPAYMNTQPDGNGDYHYIKSGLEDFAEDRGHEIKVMARVSPSVDPADPYYITNYGAYGDGWTNDADFWVNLGGDVWDIDPAKFCDFVAPKLASGITVFLTVDSDGNGGGDHWVPCVGYDKAAGLYYYYDTHDTTLHSADINGVGAPGPAVYAISFVRTVEYIGSTAPQLTLKNVNTWYWTSLTYLHSVTKGDVDADGNIEIVTGGYYNDGSRYNAQLCVWNGATLALKNVQTWYWIGDTLLNSVAVGDADGDGYAEIVTGGKYYDGTRNVAQLCVWNGATLALKNVKTWYWTADTYINSVAVSDVDKDGNTEIVTGGSYSDGSLYHAQLCVWNGATLALKNVKTWYWTSWTFINSVAVGYTDSDVDIEIVTGGCYWDGSRYNAQVCIWDASTLALEQVTSWYWTGDTKIYSVAIGDVDAPSSTAEIVTGGNYVDGTRVVAQVCVWNGATLTLRNVQTWYWTADTDINSVAMADVNEDGNTEIVTGGVFYDGTRYNAQLCIWNGATLALENVQAWYWTGETAITTVAVGDVDGDGKAEIMTGGQIDDFTRFNAQLCIWAY